MEQFIFANTLKTRLQNLLDNPHKIPNILCFYGVPAQGKTTFAKYLAKTVASQNQYFDANSYKRDNKIINSTSSLMPMLNVNGQNFRHAFIIDEWHNFRLSHQDSFKVLFDEMIPRKSLIIICCNTDSKNTIKKVLNPAIYSRCHKINFNILESERDEVTNLAMERFPLLDREIIYRNIPDWRRINQESMLM